MSYSDVNDRVTILLFSEKGLCVDKRCDQMSLYQKYRLLQNDYEQNDATENVTNSICFARPEHQ